MANNHKRKGDQFERDLAAMFTERLGIDVMRSLYTSDPMVKKGKGNCDLIGTPGLAVEAKRTETLRLPEALRQATINAGATELPCVIHRRSRQKLGDSTVTMTLDNFMKIYKAWCITEGYVKDEREHDRDQVGTGQAKYREERTSVAETGIEPF